ncbi:MAG: hypothetical protein H6875_09400 [Hyphomicrobiaceae bacterium]|nr:hypothetical protein [Hyphomicrobiaceae bacterium]
MLEHQQMRAYFLPYFTPFKGANSGIRCGLGWRVCAAGTALVWLTASAAAFDVLPDERASREQCERRFCQIVLGRASSGPPLSCEMTKTWDRVKLKKNGEANSLPWGFGDARCKVSLNIPHAEIVKALEKPKHTFQFERQTIDCKIEGSDKTVSDLQVVAAPKIKLKNGKADKVYFKIKDVNGDSSLKTLVWTAAKLADSLGFFNSGATKEINKFIHKTCEERYGANAKAGEKDKGDKKDRKDKSEKNKG